MWVPMIVARSSVSLRFSDRRPRSSAVGSGSRLSQGAATHLGLGGPVHGYRGTLLLPLAAEGSNVKSATPGAAEVLSDRAGRNRQASTRVAVDCSGCCTRRALPSLATSPGEHRYLRGSCGVRGDEDRWCPGRATGREPSDRSQVLLRARRGEHCRHLRFRRFRSCRAHRSLLRDSCPPSHRDQRVLSGRIPGGRVRRPSARAPPRSFRFSAPSPPAPRRFSSASWRTQRTRSSPSSRAWSST